MPYMLSCAFQGYPHKGNIHWQIEIQVKSCNVMWEASKNTGDRSNMLLSEGSQEKRKVQIGSNTWLLNSDMQGLWGYQPTKELYGQHRIWNISHFWARNQRNKRQFLLLYCELNDVCYTATWKRTPFKDTKIYQ